MQMYLFICCFWMFFCADLIPPCGCPFLLLHTPFAAQQLVEKCNFNKLLCIAIRNAPSFLKFLLIVLKSHPVFLTGPLFK